MKKSITKRIGSILLSAVLALPLFLTSGFTAGGEGEDNPTLSFQNEKYEGIKVFKNIYSNEEYIKADRQPIRITNPEPGDTYDSNDLAFDEFRLVIYGANNKDDLYKASERPPLKSIKFQRKLGSLLYYRISMNKTVGTKAYDLIVAPYDINDYFLYYSNGEGTIDLVFDSRKDSYYLTLKDNDDEDLKAQYTQYTAKNYYEKFRMDGAHYAAIDQTSATEDEKAKYSLFKNYASASADFYTNADDGSFFIFDGDITYFDKDNLSTVKYIRVKEQWEFLRGLNSERSQKDKSSAEIQYTGEYVYMIDDDVVTDVIASQQSGSLEVANRFDTPTHELTVSKTVPFFGVAPSDVNPFRTTDIFEYKLLINDKVPSSIQYTVLDTKTNNVTPTEDDADEDNVVKVGDSCRYVTTDGTFYLYAEESATFYGVKSGDKVEIREYTAPDRYSVLSTLSGNAEFEYVKAADSTETPQRDYASITVQYGDELNQRLNPTFTNVPNVLQVRKRVEETNIDTEKEFAFLIQKLVPDANGDPQKDSEGNYIVEPDFPSAVYTYYLRNGDNNFDSAQKTAVGGVFYLKHDQTAMFTGLENDSLYLVTESIDPAYNLLNGNQRVISTRGETVDDSLIRSKSSNYYELFVNERDEMKGIVLTKKVVDSDGKLNLKSEYTFRIEKLVSGQYVPEKNLHYDYRDGASDLNSGTTDENGYFKVRANINNFIVKFPTARGTYRITEVDPNDWNDQNNTIGVNAPNPKHEEYLYITDTDYDTYNLTDAEASIYRDTVTHNADMTTHTSDVVVDSIVCTQDRAASVDFTNRIREKTYYFDIEKLAYLDDNVHLGNADSTQRFQFKIERFGTMEDALKSDSVASETFYTDLSCTDKVQITDNGAAASPRYTYETNGYPFYAIDYPYTGRNSGSDNVRYDITDEAITREYKKADTKAVYGNGETETYKFFSTIYRGYRQIAVKKQGYYKITEIVNWSNTDYDYCLKSNRYKGYLDTETDAQNALYADYKTTHATGYDADKGQLERSVVIYVGELDNQTYHYTLGCEFFEDATGTVKYVTSETRDVLVQKRDDKGSLLYYETGSSGEETTEKYGANGNRRIAVPAPDSQFRIHETATVDGVETMLYFDDAQTQPVYQYVSGLNEEDYIHEQQVDGENNPVVDEFDNPVMQIAEYTVYDSEGNEVDGVKKCKLTASADIESNYTHTSNVWTDTVYTINSVSDALRPMASFSNVESEYALLSSNAWADNVIKRASDASSDSGNS